jgi:hypothetical protein
MSGRRSGGAAVALLVVLGPGAWAQGGGAEWRAAAPALPIEGQVRPAGAPVAIGGSAWGPWRNLCREQVTQPGRPPQRDCLAVGEARPEGAGMRLILVQPRSGLRVSALRTVEGVVAEFRAVRSDGSAPPPDAGRDALVAYWRAQFAAVSLPRQTVAPRGTFAIPIEGSPRGMDCEPEGTAQLAQRPVLVARCGVALAGRLRESETRVAIFARIAVDVPTGMVVAQSYATRIETFNAAGRSNGVVVTPTRVTLE